AIDATQAAKTLFFLARAEGDELDSVCSLASLSPLEVATTISQLLAATEVKVPARSLWVCQIISTKGEFSDLSSNTSSMLSPVGMVEPPDQRANLRAAPARAFAAFVVFSSALVSSEVRNLLGTAATSSMAV
ncbi:hypothetical protein IFO70_36255, partial [Phormidium tenue FACHB-886]|nr:hypothetical protein [Phormidium tenue FACHB-886]